MSTTDQSEHRHGDGSATSREESFDSSGPVTASVYLVSGDMTVRTAPGTAVGVRVSAHGPKAAQLLADTQITFDHASGHLDVRSPLRNDGGGFGRKFFLVTPSVVTWT